MASHSQTQRNLADFNGAWGRFQSLFAYVFPQSRVTIQSHATSIRYTNRLG